MWGARRLEAVVFDLDDTLIGWRAAEAAAMEAVAARHLAPAGVPVPDALAAYRVVMEENARHFRATGQWWFVQDRLRLLVRNLHLVGVVDPEALAQAFLAEVRTRLAWLDGAPEALAAARAAGLRVALLTNGFPHVQRPKVEQFGISDRVDFVGVSDELGHWKPKPEAFLAVCDRLGVAPEWTLMVGDSLDFDIRPARALGMATCWVDPAGGADEAADAVVRTPRELAAALQRLVA